MRSITIDYDQLSRKCTIWTSDHKVFSLSGMPEKVSEQIKNFVMVSYIDEKSDELLSSEQTWNVYVDPAGAGFEIFLRLKDIGIECEKVKNAYEYRFSSQKPQRIIVNKNIFEKPNFEKEYECKWI